MMLSVLHDTPFYSCQCLIITYLNYLWPVCKYCIYVITVPHIPYWFERINELKKIELKFFMHRRWRAQPFFKGRQLRNSENTLTKFKTLCQFKPNLHDATLGDGVSSSNEGLRPFPRGDNFEIALIHWRN